MPRCQHRAKKRIRKRAINTATMGEAQLLLLTFAVFLFGKHTHTRARAALTNLSTSICTRRVQQCCASINRNGKTPRAYARAYTISLLLLLRIIISRDRKYVFVETQSGLRTIRLDRDNRHANVVVPLLYGYIARRWIAVVIFTRSLFSNVARATYGNGADSAHRLRCTFTETRSINSEEEKEEGWHAPIAVVAVVSRGLACTESSPCVLYGNRGDGGGDRSNVTSARGSGVVG